MYDDDEYEDEAVDSAVNDGPLTFTLEGYRASQIDGHISRELGVLVDKAVAKKMDKAIDKAIQERVEALRDDVVRERLINELDICLEEGWRKTDNYGRSCGSTLTLKDRIIEMLEGKTHGYGSVGEKAIAEVIRKHIDPELKKVTSAMVQHIKSYVDEALKRNALDAVKVALGLPK